MCREVDNASASRLFCGGNGMPSIEPIYRHKGKCEPTLKMAREISRKLDIDANIVLGV
jgi:hypothetical protein